MQNLKIVAIYLVEYFDLKMIDDKYTEHNFPLLAIGMTKTPKIEV